MLTLLALCFLLTTATGGSNEPHLCTQAAQRAILLDISIHPTWTVLGWGGNETDVCSWQGLGCSDGLLTQIELPSFNLTGSLDGLLFLNPNFTLAFGCSLSMINLRNNALTGTLPSSITSLYSLKRLTLSSNIISGHIPENFNKLNMLQLLDLSSNLITGPLPLSLCNATDTSLSDLILFSNHLEGTLDISACVSLYYLDCCRNFFSGEAVGPPPGNNRLHDAYISDNFISNFTTFIMSGLITNLAIDRNPIPDASLVPALTALHLLNSLSVENEAFGAPHYLSGTLPPSVFTLGTLRSLNFNFQAVQGPLPAINGATLVTKLTFAYNVMSGTIPASVANYLSAQNSILDLRYNFLSCCGVGDLIVWDWISTNVSYAAYDLSRPRLPPGIKFSSTLQPVTQPLVGANGSFTGSQINLGNRTYPGLNCPYLLREEDEDQRINFLSNWYLDPEYTLFEGCQCDPGLVLSRSIYRGMPMAECLSPSPPDDPWWVKYWWIFVVIGAVAFAVLVFAVWKASSGARSKILQEFFDAQRRARGSPASGQISIVTTDIEAFSKLMKSSPELAMQAVFLHNDLLQRARHDCFGYVIETEGDSFSFVFESPADAVKFCIQSQLLLAAASWPKGLFENPDLHHDESSVHRAVAGLASLTSPFTLQKSSVRLSGESANHKGNSSPQGSTSTVGLLGPLHLASNPAVHGMRVRMGVATGIIDASVTPVTSYVLELAKAICNAGSGGQILTDAATFHHIKDMTEGLGCVTEHGLNRGLLRSRNDKGGWWGRWGWWEGQKKLRSDKEALILHMGDFLHCPDQSDLPTVLKPSDLKESRRLLSIYQVLPPKLVARGRAFGSTLRFTSDMVKVDGGYFDAPGALEFPLCSADKGKFDVLDPLVATVFIQVDGAKAYSAKYRSDATEVHSTLLALIKTTLRLIPGGYLAKSQDAELKYLLSFSTVEAAIYWCAQLQMASVYASWPPSAVKHWPEEKSCKDHEDIVLFRGPRIKMGLSQGRLRSISVDWTGRADVHGPSVNQAARIVDAAAWGGQIAVEERIALKALEAMSHTSDRFWSGSISDGNLAGCLPLPSRPCEFHREIIQEVSFADLASTSAGWQDCNHRSSHTRNSAVSISMPQFLNCRSQATWELPSIEQLLPYADRFTLVACRLGLFSFKGAADEVLSMVNLCPALLIDRSYPAEAPSGKGERVKSATGLFEVSSIDLPSMKFIQEMRESYISSPAQTSLKRSKSLYAQVSKFSLSRSTSISPF